MDGALPFLILILVLGASVGFAIGISAIVSRWERSVPKPGMSAFMDISRELAPGLIPSKVYVLESTSTTFTRTWFIRDATTETVIANVEYETNGDIVLKMTSGERFFIEYNEPAPRSATLRKSSYGGIGTPLLIRHGGHLRNAPSTYHLPSTNDEVAKTPKLGRLFPENLVIFHPTDNRPLASIAWLGSLTAGPFYMAAEGDLIDAIGEHGCCAVLLLECRRFF